MTLYSIALFLHIVGVLSLFALLGVEGMSLRAGMPAGVVLRILGPISLVTILVPGFYLASQVGWHGWVAVGLVSFVVIAALGAYTGISFTRGRMDASAATVSWLARVGIALGVVFDMTVKPNVIIAAAVVLVALVVGAGLGALTRPKARTA